jgi:putative membrane protein (TIGR04086 family)
MADQLEPRAAGLGAAAILAVIVPAVVLARALVDHPEQSPASQSALFVVIMVAFVAGGFLASRLSGGGGGGGATTGLAAGLIAILAVLAYAVIVGSAPPVGGVLVYLVVFGGLGALGGVLGHRRGGATS